MAYYDNYSKEEKKALAKSKVEKALTKIKQDVVSIFDNDRFADYLKFAATFHYFDVNNTILIYKQKPEAVFLASFKAWEKFSLDNWGDPNRQIFTSSQKGLGIGVLAPYILKKTLDPTPQQKNIGISYLDYHLVFVFDKSQVNNIPAPSSSWDLTKSKDDSTALFAAFKEKAPFDIVFTETSEPAFRLRYESSPDTRNESLILNANEKTDPYLLCSRIIKLFTVKSIESKLKHFSGAEMQKACECVAFMVASYFGLPTEDYSFFFVEQWGNYNPTKALNILRLVQSTAHWLIDMLEEEMAFYKSANTVCDFFDNNDVFEFNASFGF